MKKEIKELPVWKWHFSIFPTIGIVVAASILWMAIMKNESLATEESVLTWFLIGVASSIALVLTAKKRKRSKPPMSYRESMIRSESNQSEQDNPITRP